MYQHVLIHGTWRLLSGMESKRWVEVLLISTTLLASDAGNIITNNSKADFAVLDHS